MSLPQCIEGCPQHETRVRHKQRHRSRTLSKTSLTKHLQNKHSRGGRAGPGLSGGGPGGSGVSGGGPGQARKVQRFWAEKRLKTRKNQKNAPELCG